MTARKPIRVVVAKPGLDGHDRGAKVVARALRDAGMEVIYTGVRQTPEAIVGTALDEDADCIGLSILSGTHVEYSRSILELLEREGAQDIEVVVGGIVAEEDADILRNMGVAAVFGPGSPTTDIVAAIERLIAAKRGTFPGGCHQAQIPQDDHGLAAERGMP